MDLSSNITAVGTSATPSAKSSTAFALNLRRVLRSIWDFLECVGRTRARHEMLETARRLQVSQPQLAAQLRRAASQNMME